MPARQEAIARNFHEYTYHHEDDIAQAAENLRLALPLLTKYQLPANPVNFAVFYEYVSGRNADLRRDLDQALGETGAATSLLVQKLYRKYLVPCDGQIDPQLEDTIRQVVTETLLRMGQVRDETSRSLESMQQHANAISQTIDPPTIRAVVRDILADTRAVGDVGRQLEEHLARAVPEMQALRSELEQARREANTDMLTGLANRRGFDETIAQALETHDELNHGLSLLMIDVDKFKSINDAYGHLVGDRVIRMVADVLKSSTKGRDLPARFGGDEFAVLLPDTSRDGAAALGENLRHTIKRAYLKRRDTGEVVSNVTVSVGGAQYFPGESAEEFIGRCDQGLYQAKEQGRNQVVVLD